MKKTGNSLILGVSERKKPSVTNEVTNICQSASKILKGCGQDFLIVSCSSAFRAFPHLSGNTFGRRKFLGGSRDNEQTYWKIVDKCTRLVFYWLSSRRLKLNLL